jgi:hypothetical protein
MKHLIALGLAAAITSAQAAELFDNGAAVSGTPPLSVIRVGGTLLGLGAQASIANRVADDFAFAGPGWGVESLSFFAYQTGATSFPFTSVTWSIVAGDVNTGALVASGTTNVTNGGLVGYRVPSGAPSDTARAIYELIADVPDFSLAADSYWLRWSFTGNGSLSGPWQPNTADGAVGNARQSVAGGPFNAATDAGDGLGLELPFIIHGNVEGSAVPEPPSIALMLASGLAVVSLARRRRTQT